MGGKKCSLEVAVTKGLAYDALLGRDIPELSELAERYDQKRAQEALAVTTRAQILKEKEKSIKLQEKQLESQVQPHTLEDDGESSEIHTESDEEDPEFLDNSTEREEELESHTESDDESQLDFLENTESAYKQIAKSLQNAKPVEESENNFGDNYNFDPSLFLEVQEKKKLTRSQKRHQSHQFLKEKEESFPEKMSREQLVIAQKSDPIRFSSYYLPKATNF